MMSIRLAVSALVMVVSAEGVALADPPSSPSTGSAVDAPRPSEAAPPARPRSTAEVPATSSDDELATHPYSHPTLVAGTVLGVVGAVGAVFGVMGATGSGGGLVDLRGAAAGFAGLSVGLAMVPGVVLMVIGGHRVPNIPPGAPPVAPSKPGQVAAWLAPGGIAGAF